MDKFIYGGLAAAGVLVLGAFGYNLYVKHKIKETAKNFEDLEKEYQKNNGDTHQNPSAPGSNDPGE